MHLIKTAFFARLINEYDNLAPAYDLDNLGLFGQLQWDVTDKFLLSGGIRYDRFGFSVDDYVTFYDDDFNRFFDPGFDEAEATIEGGERTFDSTVFNVGTVYQMTPELSAFANFSQGFSVPRFLSFLAFRLRLLLLLLMALSMIYNPRKLISMNWAFVVVGIRCSFLSLVFTILRIWVPD